MPVHSTHTSLYRMGMEACSAALTALMVPLTPIKRTLLTKFRVHPISSAFSNPMTVIFLTRSLFKNTSRSFIVIFNWIRHSTLLFIFQDEVFTHTFHYEEKFTKATKGGVRFTHSACQRGSTQIYLGRPWNVTCTTNSCLGLANLTLCYFR